jgi:Flp pilus assembly protein TadG
MAADPVRPDRGSATLELVLLTPALIALLLLVVAGGRIEQARGQLDGTVREAARAASVERTPAAAEASARLIADQRLATDGLTCGDLTVATNTSQFRSGGSVTTTITCNVQLSDLVGIALPGTRTLSASASEPIDTYVRTQP